MHEYRVISFREKEVAEALSLFRQKSDYEPIRFDSIKVSQRNDYVVVQCYDQENQKSHQYSDHEICSALMVYCMYHKVPLPRRGSKSVFISQESIKLVIEVGHL